MVNKLSISILRSCGKGEWVNNRKDQLLKQAKEFAEIGVRSSKERISLRKELLASDLCDGKRMADEILRIAEKAIMDRRNPESYSQ